MYMSQWNGMKRGRWRNAAYYEIAVVVNVEIMVVHQI